MIGILTLIAVAVGIVAAAANLKLNGGISALLGTGAMPGPATWALLILGFGLTDPAGRGTRGTKSTPAGDAAPSLAWRHLSLNP